MILRPFFSYYGAKWRLAPRYPAPRHRVVVEPFAGSACYSLRHYERDVVLYDVDPVIAGVWRYLIAVSPSEVMALPDVGPGETVDDFDLPQEARWLIGFWFSRGTQYPRRSPSAWARSGIRPRSFWGQAARERIAAQVGHVRHWKIIEATYESADDVEATWFVDPPYQGPPGRHYRHNALDFGALGAWCRSRRGFVIACENDGADWLPFRFFHDAKANHLTKRSREAIWTSTQEQST